MSRTSYPEWSLRGKFTFRVILSWDDSVTLFLSFLPPSLLDSLPTPAFISWCFCHLSVCLLLTYLLGTGSQTQDLALAGQALCHWAVYPVPVYIFSVCYSAFSVFNHIYFWLSLSAFQMCLEFCFSVDRFVVSSLGMLGV